VLLSAVETAEEKVVSEDTLFMTKAYETRNGALSADFHNTSTGYDVNFMEAGDQGRRWSFKVKDQTKK